MVAGRHPGRVADDVAVVLDVDELVLVGPSQNDDGLQVVGGPVHDHALDPHRLATVDLGRTLAVKVDGPLGAEADGVVQNPDPVLLADGEHRKVPAKEIASSKQVTKGDRGEGGSGLFSKP